MVGEFSNFVFMMFSSIVCVWTFELILKNWEIKKGMYSLLSQFQQYTLNSDKPAAVGRIDNFVSV